MKRVFRILVALLAMLMILGTLAACGGKGGQGGNEGEGAGDTQPVDENASKLPNKYWDRDFNVAGYSTADTLGYVGEQASEDPVEAAVFKRNMKIEADYGISVVYTPYELLNGGQAAIVDMVRKDYLTGRTQYELICANLGETTTLMAESCYLMDFNSNYLTYLDLDNDCWDQNIREALSIKDHLFAMSGTMNITEKGSLTVLCYNRESLATIDLEEHPIDLVKSGDWTLEKYEEIMTQYVVTDGTGATTHYGAAYSQHFMCFLVGAGISVCNKDENDLPVLNLYSEKTINTIDKVLNVCSLPLYTQEGKVYYARFSSGTDPLDYFKNGQATFYTSRLEYLKELRDVEHFTLGYLPFPKYDSQQEKYYTYDYSFRTSKLLIPYLVEDAAFASFGLQALCENSYGVEQEYFENQCKVRGSVDMEQYEMLTLAVENPLYDIGVIFDFGGIFLDLFCDSYDHLVGYKNYEAIAVTGTNNFTTLYAAYEPVALNSISAFLESIEFMDSIEY